MISRLLDRAKAPLRHVFRAPPRPLLTDFSIATPLACEWPVGPFALAAVIHMFYPEMAEAILGLIVRSGANMDLLITTDTDDKRLRIEQVFARYAQGVVIVRLVKNRGRDILPKLTGFIDLYGNYDLLLFLHAKKSKHMDDGQDWFSFLVRNLIGSPDHLRSVLAIFTAQPKVGMVFAQHYEMMRPYLTWRGNLGGARRLARRMGIRLRGRAPLDFPSGSMFWARPAALQPLIGLGLTDADFPDELGQKEGTIAHSIERLFLHCVERAGYDWIKIADPELYRERSCIVPVHSRRELDDFLRQHRFSLIGR